MNIRKNIDTDTFWYFGGIANAIGGSITHPIGLIRVNQQAHWGPISALEVAKTIFKHRQFKGLFYRLSPSILRQFTYAFTRFGIYEAAKRRGLVDTFWHKVQVTSVSGFFIGFLNTPLDQVNIIMQADAVKPPDPKKNYQSTWDGLRRQYAEGGLKNLYRAALICSLRGMLLNVGQLSVYNQVKYNLLEIEILQFKPFNDNWTAFFFASLIAGTISTILTLPFEVVKIKVIVDTSGKMDTVHIARKIFVNYGYKGFFSGLGALSLRTIPQTSLTFLIFEKLRLQFEK